MPPAQQLAASDCVTERAGQSGHSFYHGPRERDELVHVSKGGGLVALIAAPSWPAGLPPRLESPSCRLCQSGQQAGHAEASAIAQVPAAPAPLAGGGNRRQDSQGPRGGCWGREP